MENKETQLDPDIVNLAKATRQIESNGNPTATGKSGEYGYYQYLPSTWDAQAKKAGVNVSLEQATPEQQNQVWYTWAKAKKDSGKNIGQIASMQNAGEGRPNAYLEGNKGVNKYGVSYDTADYAKKVAIEYQKLKGQPNGQTSSGYNPHPYSNPTTTNPGEFDLTGSQSPTTTQEPINPDSLGSELAGRVKDASTAISSIAGGEKGTGQSRFSGLLQLAGSVAGGLGDVVNKGIELIPGVKAIEGVIGKGVQSLAQTDSGKAIVKSLQDFGTAHPELTKDAGAAFNIATAIPILKGLGTIGNVALDGASSALKRVAEKVATKDLTATAERTIGGRTALKSTPDAIKTLIDERTLPDIADGKYITKEAFDKLSENISHIEDTQLQPTLNAATQSLPLPQGLVTQLDNLGSDIVERYGQVSLPQLKQEAIDMVTKEFADSAQVGKATAEVNRVFDDYISTKGNVVSLEELNKMKRAIRQSVNFASPKLDSDVTFHLGQLFMDKIENVAKKVGFKDVEEINSNMARLIKAQNILKHIEGKPIKTGLVGGLIKDAATVGGEVAGNATGIPLAGAYLGRSGGGYVGKKLAGISKGVLERTGKDAVRTTTKKIFGRTKGLLTSAIGQKSIR